MKIGLSLSFCIQDVLEGKIPIHEVICIIAGTNSSLGGLDKIIAQYAKTYWSKFNRKQINDVIQKIKIIEPRKFGIEPMSLAKGHWLETTN